MAGTNYLSQCSLRLKGKGKATNARESKSIGLIKLVASVSLKFSNFNSKIVLSNVVSWAVFRFKFYHFGVALMIKYFERSIFSKSLTHLLFVHKNQRITVPQVMTWVIDGLKRNETFSST